MKNIREFLSSQKIQNHFRSTATILFMVGIAFISFQVGTLVGEDSSTPKDSSIKSIPMEVSTGDVKSTETVLTVDNVPFSETYLKYIYEPDSSALVNNLNKEKYYLEAYRGSSWYEGEKTKIEDEHNDRSQSLFKYYIDIINHYEFLISQCGDCPQAEAYNQKAQEAANEFEVEQEHENIQYQQELGVLETQWGSFQSRLQTIQKLISQLEAGTEPDDTFWNLYYQFP